jgi:hypothetical protein
MSERAGAHHRDGGATKPRKRDGARKALVNAGLVPTPLQLSKFLGGLTEEAQSYLQMPGTSNYATLKSGLSTVGWDIDSNSSHTSAPPSAKVGITGRTAGDQHALTVALLSQAVLDCIRNMANNLRAPAAAKPNLNSGAKSWTPSFGAPAYVPGSAPPPPPPAAAPAPARAAGRGGGASSSQGGFVRVGSPSQRIYAAIFQAYTIETQADPSVITVSWWDNRTGTTQQFCDPNIKAWSEEELTAHIEGVHKEYHRTGLIPLVTTWHPIASVHRCPNTCFSPSRHGWLPKMSDAFGGCCAGGTHQAVAQVRLRVFARAVCSLTYHVLHRHCKVGC